MTIKNHVIFEVRQTLDIMIDLSLACQSLTMIVQVQLLIEDTKAEYDISPLKASREMVQNCSPSNFRKFLRQ